MRIFSTVIVASAKRKMKAIICNMWKHMNDLCKSEYQIDEQMVFSILENVVKLMLLARLFSEMLNQ